MSFFLFAQDNKCHYVAMFPDLMNHFVEYNTIITDRNIWPKLGLMTEHNLLFKSGSGLGF